MYHELMKTSPADWEMMRELASQSLGNPVSPMWFQMKTVDAPKKDLQTIAESRGPHIMAHMGEAVGGSLWGTVKNTAQAAAAGAVLYAGHKVGKGLAQLANAGKAALEKGAQFASDVGEKVAVPVRAVAEVANDTRDAVISAGKQAGKAGVGFVKELADDTFENNLNLGNIATDIREGAENTFGDLQAYASDFNIDDLTPSALLDEGELLWNQAVQEAPELFDQALMDLEEGGLGGFE